MLINFFKYLWKEEKFVSEVILTFLFRDLAFLLLPLFILYPITTYLGKTGPVEFLSSSSFSLVILVLIAVVLSQFIELKTRIQKTLNYKLFEGLKLYVILLIASSITLSFILLDEKGVLKTPLSKKTFAQINCILFFLGLYSLFLKVLYKVGYEYTLKNISLIKQNSRILNHLKQRAENINDSLHRTLYAISEFSLETESPKEDSMGYSNSQSCANKRLNEIKRVFDENAQLAESIKIEFNNRESDLK